MMANRRRLIVTAVLYVALIAGSLLAGEWIRQLAVIDIQPGHEPELHRLIVWTVPVYILASAVPFVPGAEIGLALLLAFGPSVVFLVYGCMVTALLVSYTVGRTLPPEWISGAFRYFGLTRASELVIQMAGLGTSERLALFSARAPRRLIPFLLRHRFLALAAAINTPGNTLLGGGGGIALAAGMSGVYPLLAYVVTVVLAVLPLPLLVLLFAAIT